MAQRDVRNGMKYAQMYSNWYSWGSPFGLGLGLVSVGVFLFLLHLANLIR